MMTGLATTEYNLPLCPSRVWFIDRLLGAARPLSLASSVVKAVKEYRDQDQKQIRWTMFKQFSVKVLLNNFLNSQHSSTTLEQQWIPAHSFYRFFHFTVGGQHNTNGSVQQTEQTSWCHFYLQWLNTEAPEQSQKAYESYRRFLTQCKRRRFKNPQISVTWVLYNRFDCGR